MQPEILDDNKMTIHSFLRQSYSQVTRHVEEGISFFKGGFHTMFEQVECCFTNMMLPVNNFLKDHTHIEKEFLQEAINSPEKTPASNIVPIEVALMSPMEENC